MVTPELIEEVAALAIRRVLEDRDFIGQRIASLSSGLEVDPGLQEEHERKEPISDEELADRVAALKVLLLDRPLEADFIAMIFRCSTEQAVKTLDGNY